MSTISFVNTQMQLINCVEYIKNNNIENNILVMDAKSPIRRQQLLELLEIPCYSKVFVRIIDLSLYGNRFVDFFLTFLCLIRIWHLSHKHIDYCILGNYKGFMGRLFYSWIGCERRVCNIVAVDDGMATVNTAIGRNEEIVNQIPFMFVPNRILLFVINRNKKRYIPKSVIFFTIYRIPLKRKDSLQNNDYKYLKSHLGDFEVPNNLFDVDYIFVGQPLYQQAIISEESYCKYLNLLANRVKTRKILYYAHPEENENKWKKLKIADVYQYQRNFLPFEVFTSLINSHCTVVGFYTSILMNIKSVNPNVAVESIFLEKIDHSNPIVKEEIKRCYETLKENVKMLYLDIYANHHAE